MRGVNGERWLACHNEILAKLIANPWLSYIV